MKLKTEKPIFSIPILDKEGKQIAIVKACPLSPKELNEIILNCKNIVWERNQRFEEPNFYEYKIRKIDKTILSWEGFEDENGKPLKCDFENKEKIFALYPNIIEYVLDKVEELKLEIEKKVEIETKN